MTCAKLRCQPVLAYPLDVHIAPFAISETLLPVRLADVGPYDRAVVQVEGGDIAFSLEAPSPPKMKRHSRWIVTVAGGLALMLAAGIGAATSTPRITTVSAPARVFAGSPVDVPYAFGGWASMQYTLTTRDGRQLSAGVVQAHEGTLHFNVPSTAGRNVMLAVSVSGPFGTKSTSHRIAIAGRAPYRANAAPGSPRISEFAVVTPVVRANRSMTLSYATDARDGEIWLLDEAGRLWARAAINHYGSTTIRVPQGTAGRQMRAVLHARNGKADAVASVGLTVLPGSIASAGTDAADDTQTTQATQATLTLSTQHAAPGESITVAIEGRHGDAQISLNDGAGNTVEQGDLLAGQSALVLSAPKTTTQKTYYVMANVIQGRGEQTMVKTLVVTPQ